MSAEAYAQRIIAMADERKEFVTDVDGYVYLWPTEGQGHLSAAQLRILAAELDRRNEKWEKTINDYFTR